MRSSAFFRCKGRHSKPPYTMVSRTNRILNIGLRRPHSSWIRNDAEVYSTLKTILCAMNLLALFLFDPFIFVAPPQRVPGQVFSTCEINLGTARPCKKCHWTYQRNRSNKERKSKVRGARKLGFLCDAFSAVTAAMITYYTLRRAELSRLLACLTRTT